MLSSSKLWATHETCEACDGWDEVGVSLAGHMGELMRQQSQNLRCIICMARRHLHIVADRDSISLMSVCQACRLRVTMDAHACRVDTYQWL